MLRLERNGVTSLLVGMKKKKNRKNMECQKLNDLNDEKHRQKGKKKGLA